MKKIFDWLNKSGIKKEEKQEKIEISKENIDKIEKQVWMLILSW
jgi:DNA-binding Xre family transcriptional regulator